MEKTMTRLAGVGVVLALSIATYALVFADSLSVNFESPTYTVGSPNGQDGWSSTGSAGSGCAQYDHAISTTTRGFAAFGSQTLRISNAVTSGCFGDMTFSKSLVNEAGETGATNGGMSGGTRQNHFEAQFDFTTALSTFQSSLAMSVSPDRGDGSRQSYLRFEDTSTGIDVFFVDVQGTTDPANFVETQVGNDLSRGSIHTAKFVIDYVDGASNDVVKIYIDGVLVHTGTTWENYYRFDSESAAEQTTRTTDSLIFRTAGTANPANAGNGFLFDNLSQSSSIAPSCATPSAPVTQTYTSGTSNFIVPTYCSLTAQVWGGGGGGGGLGGGGGGGGYSSKTYAQGDLTPASSVPVQVGSGGASTNNYVAPSGGTSKFNNTVQATGGAGGSYESGGGGGSGSGGTTNQTGGSGQPTNYDAGVGGNGGDGANGGAGGAGSNPNGFSGSAPGGGGGGAFLKNYGGAGARGQVTITYTTPGN